MKNILANGICIIEWGKILSSILPKGSIFVDFEKDEADENIRKVSIYNKE